MLSIIEKYFPDITPQQHQRFAALDALYHEWNAKINVISRRDIDNLYEHHVLHSLAIAKIITFRPGTRVLDIGTGGGFPGIPLAILFPEVSFHLVDSIGKKIRVCNEVIAALDLTNVTTQNARAEALKYLPSAKKIKQQPKDNTPLPSVPCDSVAGSPSPSVPCPSVAGSPSPLPARFDFVVSRAVMPLADLVKISRPHIAQRPNAANAMPNGLIALKGGELQHEAAAVHALKIITDLSSFFSEEYFTTKKAVYVHL